MKRVMTLYRVSTKKQYDSGTDDIPMQRQECHAFAERNSWVIVKEFYEKGVSGFKVSANDRDAVQDIKEAAQKHEFDVLLVYMFDRIGRIDSETPFVVEWLAGQGIEVWSTQEGQQKFENHTDKLVNYMRYWQANGESLKTSMRVKTVMRQLTADGVYHGGVTPFGYRIYDTGRTNKKGNPVRDIEIDPVEAKYVQMIFDKTVNEGYGSFRMAEFLNGLGVSTHNGSVFRSNTVNRILRNRFYCGYYTSGEVESQKQEHLAIVDENVFDLAQEIISQRNTKQDEKRKIALSTKGKTLLAGNVYCGHCGKRMNSSGHVDRHVRKDGSLYEKNDTRYVCYHRTRRLNDCDGQTAYSATRIDAEVSEVVCEYLERIKISPREKAIELRCRNEFAKRKKECDELRREKEKLHNQLRELSAEIGKSLIGESKFTMDILSASIELTKENLAKAEEKVRLCEEEIEKKKTFLDKMEFYYDQFVSWADEFQSASLERRKMIVGRLIDEVKISRNYQMEIKFNICYEQFLVEA